MEYFLGIDYQTWWFMVIGGVFTGYAILDGFDLGTGTLHLFFKKEQSRRIALNAIGPVWDGNEVWLVIGGGALFSGFPKVYASLLSAFYTPFMLFLVLLILRAISIEFRSKEEMFWWRKMWDISFAVSSTIIGFVLGIVLGNVLAGIPLDKHGDAVVPFISLFTPFTIFVGITTVALFSMHGAIYLVMKTEDRLYDRLTIFVRRTTIFFVISVVMLSFYTLLYMPMLTERIKSEPWLFIIPVMMIFSIANITRQISKKKYLWAFLSSAISISLLLIIVAIELYPILLPSTQDATHNLTIYNASSSNEALEIMLIMAAIGVPIVASYTTFVFWTFKGKVKMDEMSY